MKSRKIKLRKTGGTRRALNHSESSMQIIAGLGNPGAAYTHTYHNVGKLFLKYIEGDDWQTNNRLFEESERKLFSFSALKNDRKKSWRLLPTALIIPNVYMNESGKVVAKTLAKFRCVPSDLMIVHDESDLPLGSYKLSFGRGAAGHRGVASVIESLGTKNFWRLRIGVRKQPGKAGQFVLRSISKEDGAKLQGVFEGVTKKLTENEKSRSTLSMGRLTSRKSDSATSAFLKSKTP